MKHPFASKINNAALWLVFVPQLIEILRGSPTLTALPRFEELLSLFGAVLILWLRTFHTSEPTTLSTEAVQERVRSRKRHRQMQADHDEQMAKIRRALDSEERRV